MFFSRQHSQTSQPARILPGGAARAGRTNGDRIQAPKPTDHVVRTICQNGNFEAAPRGLPRPTAARHAARARSGGCAERVRRARALRCFPSRALTHRKSRFWV